MMKRRGPGQAYEGEFNSEELTSYGYIQRSPVSKECRFFIIRNQVIEVKNKPLVIIAMKE